MKRRILPLGGFLILALVLAQASTLSASPKSSAPFDKALQDAESIAGLKPSWSVMRTLGPSMGDFFGDNSLILVQDIEFASIRPGMLIVYETATGDRIAHQVVQRDGESVRAMGVNNIRMDPAPIGADRIVGAVFAVFHTKDVPESGVELSDGSPLPAAYCRSF